MESKMLRDDRLNKLPVLAWLLACTLALCLAPATALAGPALEVEQSFSQPDGSTFQGSLHGDEHFNYVVTADGYLVQKSTSDQAWYYVAGTDAGFSLAARADGAAPADALTASALSNDAGKAAYAALGNSTYSPVTHDLGDAVTLDDIQAAQGSSNASTFSLQETLQPETSLPLITIVVGFDTGEDPSTKITGNGGTWTAADQRYANDFDWHERLYGGEYSITNFYSTMSNGKFSWVPATAEESAYGTDDNTNVHDENGDGIIHVTLNRNHGNWGAPSKPSVIADMRAMYVDALQEASTYIDFSVYDTNGNDVLEKTEACILFVIAGYEASAGSAVPSAWAFQWALSDMAEGGSEPAVIDGMQIDPFISMGETLHVESAGIERQPMSVGGVSHELGHYLGLPDLYDVYDSVSDPNNTVDEYPWINYDAHAASLMSSGSWGSWVGGDGKTVFAPTSLDAYCLEALGYIKPLAVTADGSYEVSSYWSDEGYRCLKIPTDVEGEYYLVENRQYESFDQGLTNFYRGSANEGNPALYNETGGIVVWHIDEGIAETRGIDASVDPDLANTVNTVDHRPGIMPYYLELSSYRDGLPLIGRPFYNAATMTRFDLESLALPLYDGCATPAERVASGISLSVDEDASNTMSVTVDMPDAPDATVTSLTPEATALGWQGGTVRFAIAGQHLSDDVELRVYGQDGTRIADAWATVQSDPSDDPAAREASITFPENTGDAAVSHQVRAAYAGVESETAAPAEVTVASRYEQRALTADFDGVSVEVAGTFSTDGNPTVVLTALTDEQTAALATASEQLGALVVGANVTVVDAAGNAASHSGKLSVAFTVDARYEGSALWFAHQKADGTLETAKAVVSGGRAVMVVDELSPFALFQQKTGGGAGGGGTSDDDVRPLKAAAAKPLASTGDPVNGSVAATAALVAGLTLIGWCARRHGFGSSANRR